MATAAFSPLRMANHDDYQAANYEAEPDDGANPRSLDDFLQAAYDSTAAATAGAANNGGDGYSSASLTFSSVRRQVLQQWKYALMVMALGLSSAADASEMFTIGYVLGDPGFQQEILGGDLAGGGALVAGILNLGLIFGGLSAGSSEGRLGRRYILLGGLILTSFAGFGCVASPNAGLFAACRFVCGLGIGPVLASTAPLATELSPPRERGFVVSVANSFWTVGLIANAISAFVIFDVLGLSWRVFVFVCTLPSAIGFALIWWLVPESPRFLALQGKYDKAARSANRAALAMGYRGVLLRDHEIEHHFCSLTQRRGQLTRQPTEIREKFRQGMDKIRRVYQKDLRRPTLIIMTLWIAASVGGSIGQWLVTIFQKVGMEHIYLHFIFLNCACIPGNIASALLTDRIGRNIFFTSAMLFASLALFGTAGVVRSAGDDLRTRTVGIVLCTAFFYCSMTALYTCLYVMASELFPTNVRSTGVALCSTFGRIASVLAMFLNGALVNSPATLLSVGGLVLLLGSITSVIYPPNEMKLQPVLDHEGSDSDEEECDNKSQPLALVQQNVPAAAGRGRRGSELKYLAG